MAIIETRKRVKKAANGELRSNEREQKMARPKKVAASSVAKQQPALKGFAVIETGGKQYKVSSGNSLLVERLEHNPNAGETVVFDKVLLLADGDDVTVGIPYIAGVTVSALFLGEVRGKKINVLKFKSKSRWTRRYGHRQTYAKIRIL